MTNPIPSTSSATRQEAQPARLKSIIWAFGRIDPNNRAMFLCQATGCDNTPISRGGVDPKRFTPKNIEKHLQRAHREEYNAEVARREEEKKKKDLLEHQRQVTTYFASRTPGRNLLDRSDSSSTISSSCSGSTVPGYRQQNIQESIEPTWSVNHPKAKKLHLAICRMMIMDKEPFHTMQREGFKQFLEEFFPKYQIPSDKFMKERVLLPLYSTAKDMLQVMLNQASFISFDSDLWSSGGHHSYISLIGHCTFDDFASQYIVLNSKEFPQTHSIENITQMIDTMIQKWKIPLRKCHVLCHDNASNMCGAVNNHESIQSIPCFIHTSQLVLKDCVTKQRGVEVLVEKAKNLFNHFARSNRAHTLLKEIQKSINMPILMPVGAVLTRWDSVVLMLSRLVQIKASICIFLGSGHGPDSLSFSADDWQLLEKLIELLSIIKDVTLLFSQRYVTAAEIIPEIQMLKYKVNRARNNETIVGIQATVEAMNASCNERYKTYLRNYNCIIATFLDPRFMDNAFYPKLQTAENVPEQESSNIDKVIKEYYIKYYEAGERDRERDNLQAEDQPSDMEADTSADTIQNSSQNSLNLSQQLHDDFDMGPSPSTSRTGSVSSNRRTKVFKRTSKSRANLQTLFVNEEVIDDPPSYANPSDSDDNDNVMNTSDEPLANSTPRRRPRPTPTPSPSATQTPTPPGRYTRSCDTSINSQDYDDMFGQVDSPQPPLGPDQHQFPGFDDPNNGSLMPNNSRVELRNMLFRPSAPEQVSSLPDPGAPGSRSELARHLALLERDLNIYKNMPLQHTEGNPMKWWKVNQHAMPYLAIMAKKFLSAPGSSIDSERLFSASGQIINNLRTRLNPDNAESLIFLSANLPVMPKFNVEF